MKEITVVTRQHDGALAEFTEALAAAGVNIETLDAETVGDSAIFILTVDKYDVALKALARTSFQAVSEDAIVIRLEDTPGALAHILRRFHDANIGLSGARIIRRDGDSSIVAISTRSTAEAKRLLQDVLIRTDEKDSSP